MKISSIKPLLGLSVIACLVAAVAFWLGSAMKPEAPSPKRVDSSEQTAQVMQEAKKQAQSAEPVVVINPTNIVNLKVPAVGIDVGFSGETWPRQSPNCHGADTCIDPPVMDQAAWYGARALPSQPSDDAVLVYGHSNWNDTSQQAFNDLPAVRQGDAVIATTENGVFTYEAVDPRLIPYEEIPTSEFVYGKEPNKIVLVTCNSKENAGTVVVAYLVHAEPLVA